MADQICILAPAEHIDEIRSSGKTISKFSNSNLLNIKLSENGEEPATHYFCAFNYNEKLYNQIMELRKYSEVFIGNPIDFVKSKNLKIIKPTQENFNELKFGKN